LTYINEKAGTHRTSTGKHDDTVGRFDVLDKLAKKFISDVSNRETIITQAEKAAKEIADEEAQWYAKFMKVILKKGVDWVAKEKARVEGLLEGGSISGEKADEFTVRKNILDSFQ